MPRNAALRTRPAKREKVWPEDDKEVGVKSCLIGNHNLSLTGLTLRPALMVHSERGRVSFLQGEK
jgi:hypothetical protein